MEAFARVFSSPKGSNFPPDLRQQLLSPPPLIWYEDLYASYIKREPSEYTHNPTRASIAITPKYRLVIVAAGHKQIDLPLREPRWRQGLQVWTEKNDGRIHFKIDLRYYGTGMGGASLEFRLETKDAARIMAVINGASSSIAPAELPAQPQPPPYVARKPVWREKDVL